MSAASSVTGRVPSGATLSITSRRVSKEVPYFLYTSPLTAMLARTACCCEILPHQSLKRAASKLMPRPTMATSLPPGSRRFSACSMWTAPVSSTFLLPIRPAVWLNGGFIMTTVGFTSSGSTLSSCSAFSVKTAFGPRDRRRSARRGDNSLA